MAYKKFSADQLFNGYRFLEDGQVLIMSEEGSVQEIVPEKDAGDGIEYLRGIISPGFVNCHCHLELSHLKDRIPRGTGLIDFVLQVMRDRHQPDEQVLDAIERAENDMLNTGIVAVGDICNDRLTIRQKAKKRMQYHNFIEATGFSPQVAGQRFQRAAGLLGEFAALSDDPSAFSSIVPHAPYSVAEELWQKIIHFPGNRLMTIHNQETEEENSFFMEGRGAFLDLYRAMNIDISFFKPTGKSSLQSYLHYFLPGQPVIAVHNVCTSEEDIRFARDAGRNVYWCFCPNANRYISGKLPAIDRFVAAGVAIVLGTDSLASNEQLSILSEMQTIVTHFPSMTIEMLLKWATINGARALQMEGLLGSFEPGKTPGVVLIAPGLTSARRLM